MGAAGFVLKIPFFSLLSHFLRAPGSPFKPLITRSLPFDRNGSQLSKSICHSCSLQEDPSQAEANGQKEKSQAGLSLGACWLHLPSHTHPHMSSDRPQLESEFKPSPILPPPPIPSQSPMWWAGSARVICSDRLARICYWVAASVPLP